MNIHEVCDINDRFLLFEHESGTMRVIHITSKQVHQNIKTIGYKSVNLSGDTLWGANKEMLGDDDIDRLRKVPQNWNLGKVFHNKFFEEGLAKNYGNDVLETSVHDLLWHHCHGNNRFSGTISSALNISGIIFTGYLVQCTSEEILEIRRIGEKGLDAINNALSAQGLKLGMTKDDIERIKNRKFVDSLVDEYRTEPLKS